MPLEERFLIAVTHSSMPSPYAHAIAGLMLASPYLQSKGLMLRNKEEVVTLIGFSLAPDLDIIPGFLAGDMAAYHNNISHSVSFGLMICLLYAVMRHGLPVSRSFRRSFFIAASAYGLHLLMDWFTRGRGLMLWWPFTSERFQPPFRIFHGVRHSQGLLSHQHWITFATESLTMLPLAMICWFVVRKRRQSTADPS